MTDRIAVSLSSIVVLLLLPGIYYVGFLALSSIAASSGIHLANKVWWGNARVVAWFAGMASWVLTPIGMVMAGVTWRRLDPPGRIALSVVVVLALMGCLSSFLAISGFFM